MKSLEEILNILRELKPYLKEKYGVEEIALFGSYARNAATETSDIDIMVHLGKPLGWGLLDLISHLEESFGQKVDLLTDEVKKKRFWKYIQEDIMYV